VKPIGPIYHRHDNKNQKNKLLFIIIVCLTIISAISVAVLVFLFINNSPDRNSHDSTILVDFPIGIFGTTPSPPETQTDDSNNTSSDPGSILLGEPEQIVKSTPNPIIPKSIIAASTQRERWTPTPLPTSTPLPSPTPIPTFVGQIPSGNLIPAGLGPREKWIDVNLTTQTLVAYEGSMPVFQSLVSSGTSGHPTVIGQFRIWLRFVAQDMNGYRLGYDYYLKNVPYVQYFYQDYALHGTYWHNNFGAPMSHGCVNLPTPSAEWLYNWASNGTLVNIHT
jgi:lipoprotein-anchoring transpeptidase ErfK/SrfK